MTEKKKMGAGLVLSVITVLVTVAGLVLYMMNCKTNYFVKTTGTDNTIVASLSILPFSNSFTGMSNCLIMYFCISVRPCLLFMFVIIKE